MDILVDLTARFGLPVAMLILMTVTGSRGMWLFRWQYDAHMALMKASCDEMKTQRDELWQMAKDASAASREAAEVARLSLNERGREGGGR